MVCITGGLLLGFSNIGVGPLIRRVFETRLPTYGWFRTLNPKPLRPPLPPPSLLPGFLWLFTLRPPPK